MSWSPDIYNLAKVKGNRMLVNTTTANKLIADVWFARADFAKDNPDIIEGLVRGIFDGMESLKEQSNKAAAAKLMAAGYSIPEADALSMQGDAHSTNWAENQEFFLNQNNPTNFERTWNTAYYLYKRIGAVSDKTEFDQVMDFSVLQKLGKEAKYSSQKNEYDVQFAPATAAAIQGESDEILTKTVVIRHFFPEFLGSFEEDHRYGGRQISGKTLRSECFVRGGGDRQNGRTIWRSAHRDRGPFRFFDEGSRA